MNFILKIEKYFLKAIKHKHTPIPFVVSDRKAFKKAKDAVHRAHYIVNPNIRSLAIAYLAGNKLLAKYRKPRVHIITKHHLSSDEAYVENAKTLDGLIEQHGDIADIIDKLINPLISTIADLDSKMEISCRKISVCEKKIRFMKSMMEDVHGKSPSIPKLPRGKLLWKASMREAAEEIINNFTADGNAEIKQYRHLRDASDEFFDRHVFEHKQDYTKEQLYANVKKENMIAGEVTRGDLGRLTK